MRRLFLFAACFLIFSDTSNGSQSGQAAHEIQKLEFLVGEWSGEGWGWDGRNEVRVIVSLVVERKLSGNALLVEEIHSSKKHGKIVRNMLAMITYDQDAALFRFDSSYKSGRSGRYTGTAGLNSFEWGGTNEGGERFRYRMSISPKGELILLAEGFHGRSWKESSRWILRRVGINR